MTLLIQQIKSVSNLCVLSILPYRYLNNTDDDFIAETFPKDVLYKKEQAGLF